MSFIDTYIARFLKVATYIQVIAIQMIVYHSVSFILILLSRKSFTAIYIASIFYLVGMTKISKLILSSIFKLM